MVGQGDEVGPAQVEKDVEKAVRYYLNLRQGNMNPNHNRRIGSTQNPRILQFFREYFGYYKAKDVFKDIDILKKRLGFKHFNSHTASRFMYDTDAFVLHILHEDKNVLEELLTSNKVFSSYFRGTLNERDIKKAGGKDK